MSGWVEHVVWWQVYPLGFVGAEAELAGARPEPHRLARLHGWLEHLIALGANGLALGPVFTSATHGYDTLDYHRLDPRLGEDGDLEALVEACHQRGIRVLLDGVFNHAARDFPPVAAAIEAGPGSEAGGFVRWSDNGYPWVFEGHESLVTLDHSSDAVVEHVAEVMAHWLERGVDGWRLDAAYAVQPEFWARVLPKVRKRFPDAWFVGEMIHGDYADYVQRSGLDAVTQYELWKAVWSSLAERNLWELDWTLGRHRELVSHLLPLTFVGNHDVTRVASRIDDERHVPLAAVLLFFVPGVPSVYYGDEYGLRAEKEDRPGGDDAVRPEMPDSPLEVADEGDVLATYRRMVALRRRHPWLTRASIRTSEVADHHLLVHADGSGADERLVLALNLDDDPWPAPGLGEVVESGAEVTDHAVPPHSGLVCRPG